MHITFERNRTSTIVVMYSLYLYLLGLSLRNTFETTSILVDRKKRSYVSIWNGVQRFGSGTVYKRKRISAFIIDEFLSKTDRLETLLSVDCPQTGTPFYPGNPFAKDLSVENACCTAIHRIVDK